MDDASPILQPPLYGEPAPMFTARSDVNPRFRFGSLGGLWLVLAFAPPHADAQGWTGFDALMGAKGLFDDTRAAFFGVCPDAGTQAARDLRDAPPGFRWFWDDDGQVKALYGGGVYLIDPQMRVAARLPAARAPEILALLKERLGDPPEATFFGAPVLTLPRIFERDLCRELVAYYHRIGGKPSGFMNELNGKTIERRDDRVKRRKDVTLEDEGLIAATRERLRTRLAPMIERAFNWKATRIERYLVASYTAEDNGFFRAHRDNTTPGTAHRRFAVTINLNAEDYDGGALRFPEYGPRTHKPPTGGATVFSCSLLHEATPVTRGERFAFLPFLYDESGARVRAANAGSLEGAASEETASA